MVADFTRYYRMDVCDLLRGRLSPKRGLALVEHLPIDSATITALRGGPEFAGWDRQAFVTADLFDAVAALLHATVATNVKNPKKVERPEPYPRPGAKSKSSQPDMLVSRLRGGADLFTPVEKAGPGAVIPLPPS